MITVNLKDKSAKADLNIDSQNGDIGITVVSEGKQLDFGMTFEEWDLTTSFLKAQRNNEKQNAVT